MDGARLCNAVAAGFDPKSIGRLGVDILVMGGTKAGSTPTEALVIFNKALTRRLDMRLKHAGQLVSKGRYLAAPWLGMLGMLGSEDSPWVARARHANTMARRLADLMPFPIRHAVETNGVFVDMDDAAFAALTARGWHVYRSMDETVRFMCSWDTDPAKVDQLAADLSAVHASG
jgi:threonine aldolase